MAATVQSEFLKKETPFRGNAFLIINQMLELNNPPSDPGSVLVDEILQSIFFLGKIHIPPVSPEMIVSDEDMLNALRGRYPRPFAFYSSQLPRRSPFSCVLDMVVHLTGQEKENEIIKKLQEIISQLTQDKKKALYSSTICVSQTKIPNSVRYYGVSMSTSGPNAGRIMIAASCLSSWDSYVAGAVMTYYPEKVKKSYFDGTIKLPENVRCQAFNIRQGTPMDPCRSCGNLFGLKTSDKREWDYGNCAEPESVSNLFKKEEEVKRQAQPTSGTCTERNRKTAEESVTSELKKVLKMLKFTWKPPCEFYTPQ